MDVIHPLAVIMKLNIKNAFNTTDRIAFINEIREHASLISRWIECCCSSSSRLLFGNNVIMSETDCQQGDRCSSLLFAIEFHPIFKYLKENTNLDLIRGYEDDIILAGNYKDIAMALHSVMVQTREIGLDLNI